MKGLSVLGDQSDAWGLGLLCTGLALVACPSDPAAPDRPATHAVQDVATPSGLALAPDGAGFRVVFPSTATRPERRDERGAQAGVTVSSWSVAHGTGGLVVNFADLSADLVGRVPPRTVLERGRDAALQRMGATVTRSEAFELAGRPGLRVWFQGISGANAFYGRIDAVLAGGRLFQVQALGLAPDFASTKEVEAFFASFELVTALP